MECDSIFLPLDNKQGEIPKRIQLLPAGPSIKGRDGRTWSIKDPDAVVKSSNAHLPNHPVDENHAVDLLAPGGGPSPAFGWFSNITAEKDGSIWADVEWTEKGINAVSSLEYRYLSPVFFNDEKGNIQTILRAALSNNPNLPIKSLNTITPDQPAKEYNMKEILAALGLPDDATEEDAVAAIATLKTAQTALAEKVEELEEEAHEPPESTPELNSAKKKGGVDLAAYAPRSDLTAMAARAAAAEKKLAELNASALKAEAEAAVDGAIREGKFSPASKDQYLSLCANRSGLDKFKEIAAATPAMFPAGQTAPAGTPPAGQTSLNAEELTMAKSMGYSEAEWIKMKELGK